MINFKGSRAETIYLAENRHDSAVNISIRTLATVFSILFLMYWLATLFGFIVSIPIIKALGYLVLAIAIYIGIKELYFHLSTRNLKPKTKFSDAIDQDNWLEVFNLCEYFSIDVAKIYGASIKDNEPNLELFLANLLKNKQATILLTRAGLVGEAKIDNQEQGPIVDDLINSVESLINHSAVIAQETNHQDIEVSHILLALQNHHQGFANMLFRAGVSKDDLKVANSWYERLKKSERKGFFWENNQYAGWGIGRDWSSGYTPTLSDYSIDLSQFVRESNLQSQVIGREDVIGQIEVALASSTTTNVLLVGKPGIGKKTIVNGFAAKIISGNVPDSLKNKHVIQLNVQRLLAGEVERGAIEEKLLRILNDASWAGNIVLFIDNIHTLLGYGEGRVGAIDATEILLPFLSSNKLQIIGSTTPEDFHRIIEPKGSIEGEFSRINIEKVSPQDAVLILGNVALHLETQYGVFITFPVIREAVSLADRYMSQVPLPESAIRILETATVSASYRKERIVTKEDVEQAISQTTRVPVGEVKETEKEKLINLEEILHNRVIGQDEAISAIASALKRARSGLSSKSRPVGSFLFLGPTGVGKTETAKALAESYFGSEKNMIRIDMSEYQTPESLYRLIGTPTGEQGGQLISAIRDNPFNLVLLDEIEKAHPNVLNVFLQILDDGFVTDNRGEKADFTSGIIIATSNAGAEEIQIQIKAGKSIDEFKNTLIDNISQGILKPEFLNRFDAIVVYRPLTMDELVEIVDLQIVALNKRMKDKNITVELTTSAKELVAELGYQPEFGARPLRRVIQDKIESTIANRLLKDEIREGDKVLLDSADIS